MMNTTTIISALDAEISRLSEVRNLLSGLGETSSRTGPSKGSLHNIHAALAEALPKRGPGRPKGSTNKAASLTPPDFARKPRVMSAEGKARIAAAQRARWAKQNGTSISATPTAGKKRSGKPDAKSIAAPAKQTTRKAASESSSNQPATKRSAASNKTSPKAASGKLPKQRLPKTVKPSTKKTASKKTTPASTSAPTLLSAFAPDAATE